MVFSGVSSFYVCFVSVDHLRSFSGWLHCHVSNIILNFRVAEKLLGSIQQKDIIDSI